MPITLQENLRGILYTPFYAALALGAYRREGVEDGFVSAPEPARAVEGLFDGTVDVAWGGPMRVMQTYDRQADCDLVCFAEAVTRDPFFLIGREPRPASHLPISTANGSRRSAKCRPRGSVCRRICGAPASTQTRCRGSPTNDGRECRGVAPRRARRRAALSAFCRGADRAGDGDVWHAAATRGPTSYTSFYTRRSTLSPGARSFGSRARAFTARRNGSMQPTRGNRRRPCNHSFRGFPRRCCRPRSRAISSSASGAAIRSSARRLRPSPRRADIRPALSKAAPFEQAVDNVLPRKSFARTRRPWRNKRVSDDLGPHREFRRATSASEYPAGAMAAGAGAFIRGACARPTSCPLPPARSTR